MVGESHYQPALKAAARGRTVAEGDLDNAIPVVATLVPEPENKYDRNAVRVDVEGRTVGYLPREIAGDFQPVLRRLHAAGKVGSCHARIMGGGRRNYGIHLHLAPADRAVCANDPGKLEIIGGDRTVTVVGEERHQESIGAIARSDGVVGVFASLAPCTIQKGKYAGAEGNRGPRQWGPRGRVDQGHERPLRPPDPQSGKRWQGTGMRSSDHAIGTGLPSRATPAA